MLVVLMTSFAADKWITNAQLSLPLLISAVCATATAALGIPLLRRLKMGQFIREEGPKAHQSKAGTPTMGGLLVVPVGVILGSLITRDAVASQQLLSLAALTLAFMLIGGIDDWSESGLTTDCTSLEAMAARFEESASLMRRMAEEGFRLERNANQQRITHPDPSVFEAWGFVSEESPVRQLTLIPDLGT